MHKKNNFKQGDRIIVIEPISRRNNSDYIEIGQKGTILEKSLNDEYVIVHFDNNHRMSLLFNYKKIILYNNIDASIDNILKDVYG